MDRITAAEVFVHIVERASMTATADALDMSRAMVTRYLAQMEAWAGARLLHRTTRRLSLTAAGELALARCRRMLAVAKEMAEQSSADTETVHGLLRVACSQSLAQELLAPLMADFLQQHPLASIDLCIDARPVNLVEDRIDLAIRITNDLDPNLIARRLGDCPSVVCAAPAYLARQGNPRIPQDLALHNCLTYSYFGHSLWEFFGPDGGPVSVPVGGNLSANESQVLLAAAVRGAGVVLQPAYAVAALLASERLVPLLPGYSPCGMGIHAVFQSRQRMPLVLRTLLDFLAERFADLSPRGAGLQVDPAAGAVAILPSGRAKGQKKTPLP